MQNTKKALGDMLKLCAAQLKMSQQESEDPVNILTQSFIQLADLTNQLLAQNKLSHSSQIDNLLIEQLQDQIEKSIIAFQFYDRLSQRLDHVVTHLEMAEQLLLQDDDKPDAERRLLDRIKASYSMEQERKVFEAILSGESVQQVLAHIKASKNKSESDVELF